MKHFKSMKIAITDEVHLKAVCDVLESMGYRKSHEGSQANFVFTIPDGSYWIDTNNQPVFNGYEITLTDLLRLRDNAYKNSFKKPRLRVKSGEDLSGKIKATTDWKEFR